jgi:hypothetical protein
MVAPESPRIISMATSISVYASLDSSCAVLRLPTPGLSLKGRLRASGQLRTFYGRVVNSVQTTLPLPSTIRTFHALQVVIRTRWSRGVALAPRHSIDDSQLISRL